MTEPLPLLVLRVPRSPEYCLVVVAPGGKPPGRDLHPTEIVGQFQAQDGKPILTRAAFSPGQAFMSFLHQSIARRAPGLAGFVASARAQGEGYLYVIDGRTPNPQGDVPIEDIIGGFRVVAGQINSEGYWRCEKHCLYTERGFFQLEPRLRTAVLEDLGQFGGAPRVEA